MERQSSPPCVVREAEPSDGPAMAAVESAAQTILAAQDVDLDGVIVGMARLSDLGDGVLALDQVSVHPNDAGAGVGRLLLAATIRGARERGWTALTGTTFRELPFNARFYASLDAVEDSDPHLPPC